MCVYEYCLLQMGSDYPNNTIVAIEANPKTYSALVENINLNEMKNVHVVNKAAYKCAQKIILGDINNNSDLASIYHEQMELFSAKLAKNKLTEYKLVIDADTLDNILSNNKHRIGVMKIDVEGAEIDALQGASMILNNIRKIIVEIHLDNLDKVIDVLKGYGFSIIVLHQRADFVIGTTN